MKKTNHKAALKALDGALADETRNDEGNWKKLKKDLENKYSDEVGKCLCLGEVINNLLDNRDTLGYNIDVAQGSMSKKEFKKLFMRNKKRDQKYPDAELIYFMKVILGSLPDHDRLNADTVGTLLHSDYKTGERALFLMAEEMRKSK